MTNHATASAPDFPRTVSPALLGLSGGDAARIAAAIDAELATSTRRAYASAWRQWEHWCRRRGIAALPAAPEAIAAFLTERADSGLSYGTRDGACSAIAHRHHQDGLPDPTADVVVRRVRRGLRRIMGTAPRRQAHPLTVSELDRLVSSIDPLSAIGVRDRAVILLGYASALRPGELSALDHVDIIAKPTGVLVAVRRSKTDQDGHGQLVGAARGQRPQTDPIRALDAWLKIRPAGPGALFTRVYRSGAVTTERIGPRAVSRLVQARADEAGFDGIPVTGHSLRAGVRRPPPSMAPPSTGSPRRPATATSARCSTTTFDQLRLSRRQPAETSVRDRCRRHTHFRGERASRQRNEEGGWATCRHTRRLSGRSQARCTRCSPSAPSQP